MFAARKHSGGGARGEYFANYGRIHGIRMAPAVVEGRLAPWIDPQGDDGAAAPGYFVVLEIEGGKVKTIRDFRYARYVAEMSLSSSTVRSIRED